jgi:precorrin-2/cobalt-factor-2 C20-methyltransferase
MEEKMKGILYGVGVGPGDYELITLKAVKMLEAAEIIAVPQSGGEKNAALDIVKHVVDLNDKILLDLSFPMVKDKNILKKQHEKNAEIIEDYLIKGKNVAFISIGDISIYSTFGYINDIVKKDGFKTEMIAGVPSFCAVSAALNISLTEMRKPITIIPAAHSDTEKFLNMDGTKVFMKSGNSIKDIREKLKNIKDFKTYAVSDCGYESEKIFDDINKADEKMGYFTTVIVKDVKQ